MSDTDLWISSIIMFICQKRRKKKDIWHHFIKNLSFSWNKKILKIKSDLLLIFFVINPFERILILAVLDSISPRFRLIAHQCLASLLLMLLLK